VLENQGRRRALANALGGGTEMITCPLCDGVLDIEEDELDEGDPLTCDECGAGLRVVGTEPLEIASEDEDDEDDEEEDFDFDEDEDEEEEEEEEEEDW
jgi:alpha-aminoadipate carrier protein LysW